MGDVPHAVAVARATDIPACTLYVDGAGANGNGQVGSPFKTIGAAVQAAANNAVICVAEGTYAEQLNPGAKYFKLYGGFKSGSQFKTRDSAAHVSKAQGSGSGSFYRSGGETAPKAGQQLVIDGFEITGYGQGIVRATYYSGAMDVTNNYIHDNKCPGNQIGGGVFFNNVTGKVVGNVFHRNTCGRGGAIAGIDDTDSNTLTVTNNLVTENQGLEPQISHGGAFYFLTHTVNVIGNEFVKNSAIAWGGALLLASDGDVRCTANLSWNVYRENRAGTNGGGMFCDDGAVCNSDHEVYDGNCGGNIYLDASASLNFPTIAKFDHLTNINAKGVNCNGAGYGVAFDKDNNAADNYSFVNSIFWNNAANRDFVTNCNTGCGAVKTNISYSNVQTQYANGGATVTFGTGNMRQDPLFVDVANRDYHLKSTKGHWTPQGYKPDNEDSPALKVGNPQGAVPDNPPQAGTRSELGRYGNSKEASYVQ